MGENGWYVQERNILKLKLELCHTCAFQPQGGWSIDGLPLVVFLAYVQCW